MQRYCLRLLSQFLRFGIGLFFGDELFTKPRIHQEALQRPLVVMRLIDGCSWGDLADDQLIILGYIRTAHLV